jgi:N-dimethylarginine dimethylaminohydrolase
MPRETYGAIEGQGDLLRHPGRQDVVHGGFGFRTTRAALDRVGEITGATVVIHELSDPRFYHLDTCLVPLSEDEALFAPEAFSPEGHATLRKWFPKLVAAPLEEASSGFACNAHCPDGRNVLIDSSCRRTSDLLAARGYEVTPVDTSEFRKAGGSVFCMKLSLD